MNKIWVWYITIILLMILFILIKHLMDVYAIEASYLPIEAR